MSASVTGPVFLQAAEELLAKLDRDTDPKSIALSLEARSLSETFRKWNTARPSPNERAEAVNHLIELNRRVLIHVSKRTRA